MHPFIPYLLKDIAAAHRTEKPCQERGQSFAEILEEIGRMKEERKINPSQHCTCLKQKPSEGVGGFIEIKLN